MVEGGSLITCALPVPENRQRSQQCQPPRADLCADPRPRVQLQTSQQHCAEPVQAWVEQIRLVQCQKQRSRPIDHDHGRDCSDESRHSRAEPSHPRKKQDRTGEGHEQGDSFHELTNKQIIMLDTLRSRPRKRPDWASMMKEVEMGTKLRHVTSNDRSAPLIERVITKVTDDPKGE
ncbi:hypothetical protein QAD02_014035 [Eretmocerus hayati]|uniref:Uncharacterized protein n=1 Tax=Eretmocerus hayati TaxID=131215 RepID=A0ACC2P455_9HYME|nr:hypothetical protein QAD02_014035 [Eretmocerus hayati]